VQIVFAAVADPVGAGFVDSLARPGGNATGFMTIEFSTSGKSLELLKQMAPSMTRAAVLRDPIGTGTSQFAAIQTTAQSLRVEVNPVNLRDADEIEHAVAAFARAPNGGLVVTTSAAARRCGVRARSEWRSGRDNERGGLASSHFDYHAGRPAQTTCGVSLSLLLQ
jgi:putative ABC transport system substrate-binding protein